MKDIEGFIADHQEEIYTRYSEVFPEKISSDFLLEDVDDLPEFVESYMFPDLDDYTHTITLDKSCRDILANVITKDFPDGRTLYSCYKDKSISKANYLDQLYKLVDDIVAQNTLKETLSLLESQKYFDFNVSKQLDKLKDNDAAYIVEPLLLVRKDPEGNRHILLDCTLKKDDHKVKTYNFNPEKLQLLLDKLDMLNYYCCGMNWLKDSPDSPSIFIFGRDKKSCEELKVQLQNTYGIKRD